MDFYIVLGVGREASPGDIKRAYKRLARRYHPDVNPGDSAAAQQFRRIAEAYETLIDPERRRRYDVSGMQAAVPEAEAFGFEGFDFSVSVSGAAAPTFGDLFAEVLQQRNVRAGAAAAVRGADLHHRLPLSFEEAMRGGDRALLVTRLRQCATCGGAGQLKTAESRCPACHGTGTIKTARGHMVFSRSCSDCAGTGRRTHVLCPGCGGYQLLPHTEALTVHLEPGAGDGATIHIPGMGHAGKGGGEAGDLYVTLHVEPHPVFTRDGDDLHMIVPVAIHEAALGAKIDVSCLDGPVRLRIPPGTQSGQRFRIRGRGIWQVRGGERGDLVMEVRLMLPPVLDERSKALLREFGRINSEDVRKRS